jgi:SPP1 gp7 family putative phage head morphogenesis protein
MRDELMAEIVARGRHDRRLPQGRARSWRAEAGVDALARSHLETVFQTNVQTAYQNGKLEQMKRSGGPVQTMPYWQYRTAGDARVRPAHAALDGFSCACMSDPVWRRLYPPCGYNCRCTVIPLSEDEAPKNRCGPGLAAAYRWRRRAFRIPDSEELRHEGRDGTGGAVDRRLSRRRLRRQGQSTRPRRRRAPGADIRPAHDELPAVVGHPEHRFAGVRMGPADAHGRRRPASEVRPGGARAGAGGARRQVQETQRGTWSATRTGL